MNSIPKNKPIIPHHLLTSNRRTGITYWLEPGGFRVPQLCVIMLYPKIKNDLAHSRGYSLMEQLFPGRKWWAVTVNDIVIVRPFINRVNEVIVISIFVASSY